MERRQREGRKEDRDRSELQREEGEADGRGASGGRIALDGGRDLINDWRDVLVKQ